LFNHGFLYSIPHLSIGARVDWVGVERVGLEAEDECDYESRGGEFVMPEEGKRGIKGAV